MNQQWYKSNITKAILIVMEHIFVAVIAVSFLWIISYPALREEILEGNPAKKYEDSRGFETKIESLSYQVLSGISAKRWFETDGKYNPEKIVDVEEYYNNRTISGKDTSGLSYRLADLIAWGNDGTENTEEDTDTEKIIVCKKNDGTYHYYQFSDFEEMINSGKLNFTEGGSYDEGESSDDKLVDLKEGYDTSAYMGLQNEEGKVIYVDCWSYDGMTMAERYMSVNAKDVLTLVNENEEWNGRLNEAYSMLDDTINSLNSMYYETYERMESGLQEGDTNYVYLFADTKSGQIYTNKSRYGKISGLENSLKEIRSLSKYVIVYPKLESFESSMKNVDASTWRDEAKYAGLNEDDFVFAVGVDTEYPIQDTFYLENRLYEKYGSRAKEVAAFGLLSAVLAIFGLVWLAMVAGRSANDDELHLSWFDGWKTEIAAGIVFSIWLFPMWLLLFGIGTQWTSTQSTYGFYSQSAYLYNSFPYIIMGGVAAVFTCSMFLVGFLSLVRRIKARTLWRNSLLRMFSMFVRHLFANLHCVWKTIILFGVFVLIHWFVMISYSSSIMLIAMFLTEGIAFVYLVYAAIGRERITRGIAEISKGKIDYKIPEDGLVGEHKVIAGNVNKIGDGLNAALEESMKSERLKTDLITNVSHDIKTPLTSIINYVELLKQENFEDPKIQRYLEILEAKSQRLKTLTEDVVEASKISSGNISLEYMNINLVEMIQQTSGEFEEKFAARGLKEVLTLPESEAIIRVDGRRMWRVLENIYNNAAKYAMKNSRIYADMNVTETSVTFSLKNVSEQPLNISADELTERFIRGDISRSTEGSGLGLSIAKTLTQMQGGSFELYLDGDLFKVTITFPRVA